MDSVWVISILWIYLLLKILPLRRDLWSPAHGCPYWDWTGCISTKPLDPDCFWLPFVTHLFPQFKMPEVRWRLHYRPQGNNLYNHASLLSEQMRWFNLKYSSSGAWVNRHRAWMVRGLVHTGKTTRKVIIYHWYSYLCIFSAQQTFIWSVMLLHIWAPGG